MVISAGSWFTILGCKLDRRSARAANASPTQINAYLPLDTIPRAYPPTGIPDWRQGGLEVTVSVAGGDPWTRRQEY